MSPAVPRTTLPVEAGAGSLTLEDTTMWKWIKRSIVIGVAACAAGLFFFGTDAMSYVTSSSRAIKRAVKDSVPVEFEIKRARDLLDELIPEMHANLKIVAQEEVEVASLERELEHERKSIADERAKIQSLREGISGGATTYTAASRTYSRAQVIDELSRRFEHFRTAEQVLAGKEKLLDSRRAALDAAVKKLEKSRLARIELASQIESLEAQFRLVQAQSAGNGFRVEESKLSQTERLLTELRKRLEVAQRILAREARFVETIPVEEPVNAEALMEKIDHHFSKANAEACPKAAAVVY
jgi:hypothetical protein